MVPEITTHPVIAEQPLPGWRIDLHDPDTAMTVLERAFDYRGDVTLDLANGTTLTGYVFDRQRGSGMDDSRVRIMPPAPVNGQSKVTVRYAEIRRVAFSERDPAAGKSFETWVKKYIEKKLAGEAANIESEVLD